MSRTITSIARCAAGAGAIDREALVARHRVVQRHMLYLGEINDSPRAAWEKTLAVFDETQNTPVTCALFPADRTPPVVDGVTALPVQLAALRLERSRAWGACWLGDSLWRDLKLDEFFAVRLGASREGTDWEKSLS